MNKLIFSLIIFGLLFSFNVNAQAELPKTTGGAFEMLKQMIKLMPQEIREVIPEVTEILNKMLSWTKNTYKQYLAQRVGELWNFLKEQFSNRVEIFRIEFEKEWNLLKLDIQELFQGQ